MPLLFPVLRESQFGSTTVPQYSEQDMARLVMAKVLGRSTDNLPYHEGDVLQLPEIPADLRPGEWVFAAEGIYEVELRIILPLSEISRKSAAPGYNVVYVGRHIYGDFG